MDTAQTLLQEHIDDLKYLGSELADGLVGLGSLRHPDLSGPALATSIANISSKLHGRLPEYAKRLARFDALRHPRGTLAGCDDAIRRLANFVAWVNDTIAPQEVGHDPRTIAPALEPKLVKDIPDWMTERWCANCLAMARMVKMEIDCWLPYFEIALMEQQSPDPPKARGIVSHGQSCYSVNGEGAVCVEDSEDAVLQAFLKRPAMTYKDLHGVHPKGAEILKALRTKYGGMFSSAITLPGRKGKGGYRVLTCEARQ